LDFKNKLWTEKFRPSTLQGYVYSDDAQESKIKQYVKDKNFPNLLITGSPGTGKTTVAKILINECDIDAHDVMEINASRETGVDTLRDKVSTFAQIMAHGDFKVVLFDEADYSSPQAQAALRGMIEQYASNVRFIFTCNKPHKIMSAIKSRCTSITINKLDKDLFMERIGTVLTEENIAVSDIETLDYYIKASYPDLRKCLNLLQENSLSGTLELNKQVAEYEDFVDLFLNKRYTEARKNLCAQVSDSEMETVFEWLFEHLEYFGNSDEQIDDAILILRNGMINLPLSAFPEINLSATIIELAQNKEK